MATDGTVVIDASINISKADKELAKLKKNIENLEKSISEQEKKKSPLVEQAEDLNQKLKAARAEVQKYAAAWEAGTAGADKEQSTAIEKVSQLESKYKDILAQIDKIDGKLAPAYEKLDGMKAEAGGLEQQIALTADENYRLGLGLSKAEKYMERFVRRVKGLARRAFVFTIIATAFRNIRDWMGKAIKTNDEAVAAIARLKGALFTLVQPVVEVIIPVFTDFVNLLADLIWFAARIFSSIFGTTAEESAKAAEGLYGEASALGEVGTAAKKAEKSLAGFDEINRLTAGSAAQSSVILPDFSAVRELPAALKELAADLELKIQSLKFSWDEKDFGDSSLWVIALSGILGAVIGAMFGGVSGAVIGILLGLSIGLIACTFLDKTSNPAAYTDAFMVVLTAILGTILGAVFGGITGGIIGLLFGVLISITALEFAKGEASDWDAQNTIITVLSAILGAILGGVFGGLVGGAIGLLLGAIISFIAIKFNEGGFDKDAAIASLRITLFAILGLIFGAMFGGLVGGVVGLMLGMTVGFSSVAFDEELEAQVRTAAQKALNVALTTIIGALIGAVFGGGIFGGIVGGVIGLVFGLAITLTDASITDKTSLSGFNGGVSNGGGAGRRTLSSDIPGLATGAVIPPNREFLAVLGDQRSGTNIEAPLSTIEQAVENVLNRRGTGGGMTLTVKAAPGLTRYLKYELDAENTRRGGKLTQGGTA